MKKYVVANDNCARTSPVVYAMIQIKSHQFSLVLSNAKPTRRNRGKMYMTNQKYTMWNHIISTKNIESTICSITAERTPRITSQNVGALLAWTFSLGVPSMDYQPTERYRNCEKRYLYVEVINRNIVPLFVYTVQ